MRKTGYLFLIVIILLFLFGQVYPARAQEKDWSGWTNLSKDGSSSDPTLLAFKNNVWEAVWWDKFDGVMVATYRNNAWGKAYVTQFHTIRLQPDHMPLVVADAFGRVHAYWTDQSQVLWHAQLSVGDINWSYPDSVSDGVVAFQAASSPSGYFYLAFVRNKQTSKLPAGVYVRVMPRYLNWQAIKPVYTSLYLRTLKAGEVSLQLSTNDQRGVYLLWNDPREGAIDYEQSLDYGKTWTNDVLADAKGATFARQAVIPGGGPALRVWGFASQDGGCTLYQQVTETVNGALQWSSPAQIMPGLTACPANDRMILLPDQSLLWIWGEGTPLVQVARWDAQSGAWTGPQDLEVQIPPAQGADSQQPAAPVQVWFEAGADQAMLAALDSGGDVWNAAGTLDLVFPIAPTPVAGAATPTLSPWGQPQQIADIAGALLSQAAAAYDYDGGLHLVWIQQDDAQGLASLFYAHMDEQGWSRPVQVYHADSGVLLRQVSVLVGMDDAGGGGGLLHLAWSGGALGQIMYQRVPLEKAGSPSSFSDVQTLSVDNRPAAWPRFGQDAYGRLYILYAVPLNEGRGIYLIRSEDQGRTWSQPQNVFNAAAANWSAVDHPALAVGPDGALYAAWVQTGLPGVASTQGIDFASSTDGGQTWSEALQIAGAGNDWPLLTVSQDQVSVLYSDLSSGRNWQRSRPTGGDSTDWGVPAGLAEMQDVLQPLGASIDQSNRLYLVGLDPSAPALKYASFSDQWSDTETDPLFLGSGQEQFVVAAALPEGGKLSVIVGVAPPEGAAQSATQQALAAAGEAAATPTGQPSADYRILYLERAVADAPDYQRPAAIPLPTLGLTPTPAVTRTPMPTLTVTLSNAPLGSTSSTDYLPLIIGGGLAVVLVVISLAFIFMGKRK